MKLLSRLKSISVAYKNESNKPTEFNNSLQNRKNFTDSLKKDPLISIDTLHFSYELNIRVVPWNEPNKWLVKNTDGDDLFSFTCIEDKKFIEILEQKLVEKMINHHSINRLPSAGIDINPK